MYVTEAIDICGFILYSNTTSLLSRTLICCCKKATTGKQCLLAMEYDNTIFSYNPKYCTTILNHVNPSFGAACLQAKRSAFWSLQTLQCPVKQLFGLTPSARVSENEGFA